MADQIVLLVCWIIMIVVVVGLIGAAREHYRNKLDAAERKGIEKGKCYPYTEECCRCTAQITEEEFRMVRFRGHASEQSGLCNNCALGVAPGELYGSPEVESLTTEVEEEEKETVRKLEREIEIKGDEPICPLCDAKVGKSVPYLFPNDPLLKTLPLLSMFKCPECESELVILRSEPLRLGVCEEDEEPEHYY